MQTDPEELALLAFLVRLTGARRILEVGTFTGYSSTGMALAMPPEGSMVCCDLSPEWTDIARRAWADAGVADRITLRLGPALESMDAMLAAGDEGSFDIAYIDADKPGYPDYYERALLNQMDAAGIDVEQLSIHTPDLDDVFFAVTGHPIEAGETARQEAPLP